MRKLNAKTLTFSLGIHTTVWHACRVYHIY